MITVIMASKTEWSRIRIKLIFIILMKKQLGKNKKIYRNDYYKNFTSINYPKFHNTCLIIKMAMPTLAYT